MRHKPTFNYCGLTVVLSNPSRDDTKQLLSGRCGNFFNYKCLQPYTNRFCCDIRTSDTINEGLLPNTRGLLLLGEKAFREWTIGYEPYTIGEQRGSPLKSKFDGVTTLTSFLPIDALDIIDWEGKHNPLASSDDESEREDEYEQTKKHGKTARRNYGFWLIRDTKKLLAKMFPDRAVGVERIALHNTDQGTQFNIYPSSQEVIDDLTKTKDTTLYLDIETDRNLQLTCFGYTVGNSPVIYVVPITRWNYVLAYHNVGAILRALALALQRNTVVIHHSQFDLLILAWKYKLLVGRLIYDTMLAQHKCFVDVEKSLGHGGSLWTWEEYHKDEGILNPCNTDQERSLWTYNAKDIKLMRLLHRGQIQYASSIPGLMDSINLSNDCCYPFLLNTLTGIGYDASCVAKIVAANDALCEQYIRLLNIALGKDLVKTIVGQSKSKGILASNKQCTKYFHEMLGYPVVKKSLKTGEPSLDADALYKLQLKHSDNPVIAILLKLRERLKESSSLKFTPWKDEKGEYEKNPV